MVVMHEVKNRKNVNHSIKKAPSQSFTLPQSGAIASALDFIVPSWPLQNAVAVNPFWNLKNQEIASVLEELAPIVHESLYMSLNYYLGRYQAGFITDRALHCALQAARLRLPSVPEHIDELVQLSKTDCDITQKCLTFAEYFDQEQGTSWASTVQRQISHYAAAYFDQGQAVAPFPWKDASFWQAWKSAQSADGTMEAFGIKNFRDLLEIPRDGGAEEFAQKALTELQLPSPFVETRYLRRLLATVFGWATQFQLCEWQKSLGYSNIPEARSVELLAVLLTYDRTLRKVAQGINSTVFDRWKMSISSHLTEQESRVHSFELHQIWQSALELSYQTDLAAKIHQVSVNKKNHHHETRYQIALCIDVRSEVLRRALEDTSSEVATVGFAGFFGMPFTYRAVDEKKPTARLPVLLPPAFAVDEKSGQQEPIQRQALVQSFFRNLRKAPLSSFAYVEIFGIYSVVKMLQNTWQGTWQGTPAIKKTVRLSDRDRGPDIQSLRQSNGTCLTLDAKIERAAVILRHMGVTKSLRQSPPRILVIMGHASEHLNNAFRSSLECGACGGHAGDINARVLTDLLNDPDIREGLAQKGLNIPPETWVVAALHETVTDEIVVFDRQKIPPSHSEDMTRLEILFSQASLKARHERQGSRSHHLDPLAGRRSHNWSETRPEWGLAGNASFIVAPRSFTKNVNLAGRAFLHDYDASQDEGFATLELIMTAPMLVTHWINIQYYVSTVAPRFYGSGNKALHNLVNESGVFEGNGGDLRVGLPLQSVHDGEKFVHEPLRLSVLIAAPRHAIEDIIRKHESVRHLVDNGWIHLMHLDPDSREITRRRPGGLYIPVEILEALS